jgi:hypothetical protein
MDLKPFVVRVTRMFRAVTIQRVDEGAQELYESKKICDCLTDEP